MLPLRVPVKSFNFSGYRALVDQGQGIYPYFSVDVRGRMKRKLSANIVTTGEGGVSKTYTSALLAKILNKKWNVSEDLVMTFDEYMEQIMRSDKAYVPLLFDEPQDALYNRDWQQDINKALVKTMTSQRFRLRPIIIPIINQSLLDVNIRKYLLNYHVVLLERGQGIAYKLSASQTEDKLFRQRICRIKYGLMDINQCDKESCLRCIKLEKKTPSGGFDCMIWRAIYERKKIAEINKRDTESQGAAKLKRARRFTDKEIILGVKTDVAHMVSPGQDGRLIIDPDLVATHIEETLGLPIGINRALRLRRQMERIWPQHSRAGPKT